MGSLTSFAFLYGHWSLFCSYCEAAPSFLKHTLWADVFLLRATLMFIVNSDHQANVACQWETLAQQIYRYIFI